MLNSYGQTELPPELPEPELPDEPLEEEPLDDEPFEPVEPLDPDDSPPELLLEDELPNRPTKLLGLPMSVAVCASCVLLCVPTRETPITTANVTATRTMATCTVVAARRDRADFLNTSEICITSVSQIERTSKRPVGRPYTSVGARSAETQNSSCEICRFTAAGVAQNDRAATAKVRDKVSRACAATLCPAMTSIDGGLPLF